MSVNTSVKFCRNIFATLQTQTHSAMLIEDITLVGVTENIFAVAAVAAYKHNVEELGWKGINIKWMEGIHQKKKKKQRPTHSERLLYGAPLTITLNALNI